MLIIVFHRKSRKILNENLVVIQKKSFFCLYGQGYSVLFAFIKRLYTQCNSHNGLCKGVYNLIEVISNEPNK